MYYFLARALWITFACAQLPVILTQPSQIVMHEKNLQGFDILNLQILLPNKLIFTCIENDSLVQFHANDRFKNFKREFKLSIHFVNCFDNATGHKNYQKFSLESIIEELPLQELNLSKIVISNQNFGIADPRIFFHNFQFNKYKSLVLRNFGYTNTAYLQKIQCSECHLHSVNQINFTNFVMNSIKLLQISGTEILNFTKRNLVNFPDLSVITFYDFVLDDQNTFNVSKLFEQNLKLCTIWLENSRIAINLHEDLFLGMDYLVSLRLNSLKLEILPANLFRSLLALSAVQLKHNNFKHIDSNMFANNINLEMLNIGMGEFFDSPEFQNLKLNYHTNVGFDDANFNDTELLSSTIQKSDFHIFVFNQNTSMAYINLLDLIRQTIRPTKLTLTIYNIPFRINMSELQNRPHISDLSPAKYKNVNTELSIFIFNPTRSVVHCAFDSAFFIWYLNDNLKMLNVYLEEYNATIKISVRLPSIELFYQFGFFENCPNNCSCYHNPLLDDITLDCSHQSLTSVPIIPYPSQFEIIDRIHLNLADNLITNISFDLQNEQVLQKISIITFYNNPVQTVYLRQNMAHLNTTENCTAPSTLTSQEVILYGVEGKQKIILENLCRVCWSNEKDEKEYLRSKPIHQISEILNNISRDTSCHTS